MRIALVLMASAASAASAATQTVVTSERYQANPLHRFVLGDGYRALWSAPVELPVLDLANEAGGLRPVERLGGQQTPVLALAGADGGSYTFRATDKDPSAVLHPLLRDTFVAALVQDQMAAQHPGGPLPAGVLAEAAGVLQARERLVVMPDDPSLGEFRQEFAGRVGSFYEYPQPAKAGHRGFRGAIEIIDHEALYARLAAGDGGSVDARLFLRARLFDLLLGDFDRHRKQWRWARFEPEGPWHPVPEDRDMAFVRYEGLGPRIVSLYVPILQRYGPDYPRMIGLTLHGWEQDRWILPVLAWQDWLPVIDELMRRIDDATIDRAVAALPAPWRERDGERLREHLRGRRDRLREGARAFYEHLAVEVDVQGSDAAERVRAQHAEDGSLLVEIERTDASLGASPRFRRRFLPDETRDVRIYLRAGPDVVAIEGTPGPIGLRIVGRDGPGLIDAAQGEAVVYDERGAYEVITGPRATVDTRRYERPEPDGGFVDVEGIPPRDWGSDLFPLPRFSYEKDVGVFLGIGAVHTRYGFRTHPWSSRHVLSAGWAFEAQSPRVDYAGAFRRENSELVGHVDLRLSGIEMLRFYGFGNQTSDDAPDRFFRVRNEQYRLATSVELPLLDDRLRLSGGPWVEFSRTKDGRRLIDVLAPYGSGGFGSVGAFGTLQIDTRATVPDSQLDLALPFHDDAAAGYPLSGFLIDITGTVSPPLWDVEKTWGSIQGSAAWYGSVGEDGVATLALRAGGKQTFGRVPYFGAAYVGGGKFFSGEASVRGYRAQRFGGDASLFGNADLRVKLGRVKLLLPGDIGVLAFADVGRVFVDGENSDRWHPSYGGGVWFAPLARTNAITITVADSTEETLAYVRFGFHF